MRRVLPIVEWLLHYRKQDFRGDINAGLTTAVMLIPQGMAYALLAGLTPISGLYASLFPLFVYALFGTSRQLAVGPVAMVSLMVASGIGSMAEPGAAGYIMLAALLALMAGLIQLLMGVTRLGFLVNFLSRPVISGFTSAAALVIGFSQMKHLLGIFLPRSHNVHTMVWNIFQHIGETNLATLLVGIGTIALLLFLKRRKPLFPGALIAVMLGTLIVWGLRLDLRGVATVGVVPRGLPGFSIPRFDISTLRNLLPTALGIVLVGFVESIAVAKAFASKNRYEVNANQELIGLGLANITAGVFGGYPVTGGFSRTAVNAQAGSRTPLSSIVTAAMIGLTLQFLTPLFFYLPAAVLAAIIMVAVFGLVDVKEVYRLSKVKPSDMAVLLVTFLVTLLLGIERGVLASVVVSLLLVIKKTLTPHSALLGRLPGTEVYRNIERYREALNVDGLILFRIDASLYFANVNVLLKRLKRIEAGCTSPLKAIVLDFQSVNDIDSTADSVLHELASDLALQGITLYFTNVKGPVRDVMVRSGFYHRLGKNHFFFTNHDAVIHFLGTGSQLHNEEPEKIMEHKV